MQPRIRYHGAYKEGSEIAADAVLAVSFDDGTARDHSTARHNGTVENAKLVDGKYGKALQFQARVEQVRSRRQKSAIV